MMTVGSRLVTKLSFQGRTRQIETKDKPGTQHRKPTNRHGYKGIDSIKLTITVT